MSAQVCARFARGLGPAATNLVLVSPGHTLAGSAGLSELSLRSGTGHSGVPCRAGGQGWGGRLVLLQQAQCGAGGWCRSRGACSPRGAVLPGSWGTHTHRAPGGTAKREVGLELSSCLGHEDTRLASVSVMKPRHQPSTLRLPLSLPSAGRLFSLSLSFPSPPVSSPLLRLHRRHDTVASLPAFRDTPLPPQPHRRLPALESAPAEGSPLPPTGAPWPTRPASPGAHGLDGIGSRLPALALGDRQTGGPSVPSWVCSRSQRTLGWKRAQAVTSSPGGGRGGLHEWRGEP